MENYQTLPKQFINCTLPKAEWTHEAHLITCVWHLEKYSKLEAICILRSRIITYNHSVGGQNTTSGGYHETLTQFYVKIINHFLQNLDDPNLSFEEKCLRLLRSPIANRTYPLDYYTKELLFSLTCRATWVEPDLKSLE